MDNVKRIVEFERLNTLGKTVFVAGMAVHAGKGLLQRLMRHVARIAVESERAFKEGLNPNIEDARILEETSQASPPRQKLRDSSDS